MAKNIFEVPWTENPLKTLGFSRDIVLARRNQPDILIKIAERAKGAWLLGVHPDHTGSEALATKLNQALGWLKDPFYQRSIIEEFLTTSENRAEQTERKLAALQTKFETLTGEVRRQRSKERTVAPKTVVKTIESPSLRLWVQGSLQYSTEARQVKLTSLPLASLLIPAFMVTQEGNKAVLHFIDSDFAMHWVSLPMRCKISLDPEELIDEVVSRLLKPLLAITAEKVRMEIEEGSKEQVRVFGQAKILAAAWANVQEILASFAQDYLAGNKDFLEPLKGRKSWLEPALPRSDRTLPDYSLELAGRMLWLNVKNIRDLMNPKQGPHGDPIIRALLMCQPTAKMRAARWQKKRDELERELPRVRGEFATLQRLTRERLLQRIEREIVHKYPGDDRVFLGSLAPLSLPEGRTITLSPEKIASVIPALEPTLRLNHNLVTASRVMAGERWTLSTTVRVEGEVMALSTLSDLITRAEVRLYPP